MNPRCPHCNGEIRWEANRVGQSMTCCHCNKEFIMPVAPPPMPVQQQVYYATERRGCGHTIARYIGLTFVALIVLWIISMFFIAIVDPSLLP